MLGKVRGGGRERYAGDGVGQEYRRRSKILFSVNAIHGLDCGLRVTVRPQGFGATGQSDQKGYFRHAEMAGAMAEIEP